ncbi:hypothetical protein ACFFT9_22260 [Chromobacterium violaceum]|uniref:hypothetical protein n=1 Tax=Chromobacterium violaceum TaxID=536 RepID=UPI0035E70B05
MLELAWIGGEPSKKSRDAPQKWQFISEVAPIVVAAIMLLPDSLKISGYSRCPAIYWSREVRLRTELDYRDRKSCDKA